MSSLEPVSEEFKNDVADERRHYGDHEVRPREDVADGPEQSPALRHTRMRELAHQQVGIKKEYDERHLNERRIDPFFHLEMITN
jgi:hypothetical protein